MIRFLGVSVAALLLLVVAVVGGVAGAAGTGAGGLGGSAPSEVAIGDIPADSLVLYQQAGERYGLDWAVIAGIGKLECDHGRNQAPGCHPPGSINSAGATGPMQFLGSTWYAATAAMTVPSPGPPTTSVGAGYATDGDGDGLADVWNAADAIFAAARLLQANGAPGDYRRALSAYNPSDSYVNAVLAKAAAYRRQLGSDATGKSALALGWAVAHVGRYSYNLGPPTDRGGSLLEMQRREPAGTTCDCSMYVRWSMAQAGLDVGLTTVTQWTANGRLPDTDTAAVTHAVERGIGSDPPPGGYRPADLIFFGHDAGGSGHVALWLGDGQIVQCSASGNGSNIRPLAGYVAPTGWLRWR